MDYTERELEKIKAQHAATSLPHKLANQLLKLTKELNYLQTLTSEGDQQAEKEIYYEELRIIADVVTGKEMFDAQIALPHGNLLRIDGLYVHDFEKSIEQPRLLLKVKAVDERATPIYSEPPIKSLFELPQYKPAEITGLLTYEKDASDLLKEFTKR